MDKIKDFLKSVLAGMCISIGCISYLSVDNKYVGTFLFSLGLLTILTFNLNLFTGKVGYLCSIESKLRYLWSLFTIWIGNLLGCGIMALMSLQTRIKIDSSNLVLIKDSDSWVSLLILGVICGMLMHIACKGYKIIKNPLIVVLPVMVFILIGAEHCVADMFYWLYNKDINIIALFIITLGNAIGGNLIELITEKIK